VAEAVREKAVEALRLIDPASLALRPQSVATLLQLASAEERKDLGEADGKGEIGEHAGDAIPVAQTVDLSVLTDEELDFLEHISEKYQFGGGA
jgi:hypothetical protein